MRTAAKSVGDHDAEPVLDFFTGISIVVDQCDNDARVELPQKLRRLVTAHRAKDVSAIKLAAEDLSRFLGGMQGVADAIARAAVSHIKRRPRA